jgi:hypothetical protein
MSTRCADTTTRNRAIALTKASSGVGVIISSIEGVITSIENETDCEALKSKIPISLDSLKETIESNLDAAARLAKTYIKLAKLPKSLKGILTFAKNLIIGTILPQLQAYIQLTQDLIRLTRTLSRLTSVIENVVPKLQQCAIDTINEEIFGLQSKIDTRVNSVIVELTKQINQELCNIGPSLQDLGVELNDAVINTTQLVFETRSLNQQAENAITQTLNNIGSIGTALTEIAPITFNIDTTTQEDFERSIGAGAFTEFLESVDQFFALVSPTNTSLPTLIGTPSQPGEDLVCDVGDWEGEDITYSYQWYRNDLPINNATNPTYQLTRSDGNSSRIYCEVTATNIAGEEVASTPTITTEFITGGIFIFGQYVQ